MLVDEYPTEEGLSSVVIIGGEKNPSVPDVLLLQNFE
jgi:hypothetical protein